MPSPIFRDIVASSLKMSDATDKKKFLYCLSNGISDLFGNVSLKQLMRLINLHVSPTQELERSRTLGGTRSGDKKRDFGFLRFSPSTIQTGQTAPKANPSTPPTTMPQASPSDALREEEKFEDFGGKKGKASRQAFDDSNDRAVPDPEPVTAPGPVAAETHDAPQDEDEVPAPVPQREPVAEPAMFAPVPKDKEEGSPRYEEDNDRAENA